VMGVMNVVPYAGPLIGGVISVLVGVISPIGAMGVGHTILIIIAVLLVIKGLDDFMLQPTLYSERVKAHPLEIFLVILIAGSLAGILGMLLAIPSYTVIRVFAKEFFSQFSLVRKLTEKI
jgi:FAD synthase